MGSNHSVPGIQYKTNKLRLKKYTRRKKVKNILCAFNTLAFSTVKDNKDS